MAKRIRKRDLIIEFLQLITGIGVKKGKKAAPRFELGIKDLQSSALPLGHAAVGECDLLSPDRISQSIQALLVLSNGHGEDLIALRVLESIHKLEPSLKLEVMPLVGEGKVFDSPIAEGWLRLVGPKAALPSGGFSNQSFRGLIADLSAGLTLLCIEQWKVIRRTAVQGRVILAIGDLLPLIMAWGSGANYGFVGTPKSDYTWRSRPGNALSDKYHKLKGSEWDPWEWVFMRSSRCKLVAVRDQLTARGLRRHQVIAYAPGNPMMDNLNKAGCPSSLNNYRRVLLLCGSRMPEALSNFERLLNCLNHLKLDESVAVLVALGSQPTIKQLDSVLSANGYKPNDLHPNDWGSQSCWRKGSTLLLIGTGQFPNWVGWAEVGIATAGTATEQLVGLGKPAVSLIGPGPQFKRAFAIRQSRLLNGAVEPFHDSKALAKKLKLLLMDSHLRDEVGLKGIRRMGSSGGGKALAKLILSLLVDF